MKEFSDQDLLNEIQNRFGAENELYERITQLLVELKAVNKKLKKSELVKSQFLANVRNEIYNPLTAIIGLSKKIETTNDKHISDTKKHVTTSDRDISDIKKYAKMINKEAFNLDFQLKNIFIAAEIEAGEFYPEISKGKIGNMIKEIIASFRHDTFRKNIAIDIKLDSPTGDIVLFNTDVAKLGLVVTNLLSNAIEYSHKDGIITISANQEDDGLTIQVSDNGVGISKEDQEIIFDRFTQLDSSVTKAHFGHGLGLSIVQAIASILGGNVEAKSIKDEGSDFIIFLPNPETQLDNFSEDEFLFEGDEVF